MNALDYVFNRAALESFKSEVATNKVEIGHKVEHMVLTKLREFIPDLVYCGNQPHHMDLFSAKIGLRIEVKFMVNDTNIDHKFFTDMQYMEDGQYMFMYINMNPSIKNQYSYVTPTYFYVNGRDLIYRELYAILHNIDVLRKGNAYGNTTTRMIREIHAVICRNEQPLITISDESAIVTPPLIESCQVTEAIEQIDPISPEPEISPNPEISLENDESEPETDPLSIDDLTTLRRCLNSKPSSRTITPLEPVFDETLKFFIHRLRSELIPCTEVTNQAKAIQARMRVDGTICKTTNLSLYMRDVGVRMKHHSQGQPDSWTLIMTNRHGNGNNGPNKLAEALRTLDPAIEVPVNVTFTPIADSECRRYDSEIMKVENLPKLITIYRRFFNEIHREPYSGYAYRIDDGDMSNIGRQWSAIKQSRPLLAEFIKQHVFLDNPSMIQRPRTCVEEIDLFIRTLRSAIEQRTNFREMTYLSRHGKEKKIFNTFNAMKFDSTNSRSDNMLDIDEYRIEMRKRAPEIIAIMNDNRSIIEANQLHRSSTTKTITGEHELIDGGSVYCYDYQRPLAALSINFGL